MQGGGLHESACMGEARMNQLRACLDAAGLLHSFGSPPLPACVNTVPGPANKTRINEVSYILFPSALTHVSTPPRLDYVHTTRYGHNTSAGASDVDLSFQCFSIGADEDAPSISACAIGDVSAAVAEVQSFEDNAARWVFVTIAAGYGDYSAPFRLVVEESCTSSRYDFSLQV
mmetsp:Transcript_30548/g.90560  ORF Transcript_30548/g.90560 Transcript_30548/m.90560 type:complete len:173 (-) Transcript_30548:159-677(-)|eukprot:362000-Chlamydomonas_euryale.AAC.1